MAELQIFTPGNIVCEGFGVVWSCQCDNLSATEIGEIGGGGQSVSSVLALAMGEEDLCSHGPVLLLRFLTALLLIEVSCCAASDVEALLAIKEQIGTFGNGDVLASWNGTNPCNWTGILCGGPSNGSVVTLSLPSMNLTGTLDPMIGSLSSLQTLNLSGNFFAGPIPSEMGNCHGLKYLDLSGNNFDGNLSGLLGLKNLTVLNLKANNISGIIPPTIGILKSLRVLNLKDTSLYGEIPGEIGNCTNLETLELSRNQFLGPIPPSLFHLKELRVLGLMSNMLNGALQDMASTSFGLQRLSLSGNNFSGQLPAFISNLTELKVLTLARNKFTGSIPTSVWGLTKLEVLDVSANRLSGAIPTGIGNLLAMSKLSMHSNAFKGPIPRELFDCQNLTKLILYHNQLSSQIPREIGNLTNLAQLRLDDNELTGSIPAELANCSLEYLNLTANYITGNLPAELARLSKLVSVCMASNLLTGVIPSEFFSIQSLENIMLSDNLLTGLIPDNFTRMDYLLNLELAGNQLTGPFPESLGSLRTLQKVDLGGNQLTGSLGGFSSYASNFADMQLQCLKLYDNRFSGPLVGNWTCLRGLLALDLHGNDFSGPVPSFGRDLFQVVYVDLSSNRLSGAMPTEIVYCDYLTTLNLSFNHLEGGIPNAVPASWHINDSVVLDFSGNNITGSIPEVLNLPNLILNVSNNNLSGPIPSLLQGLGIRSFLGNPSLCGPPLTSKCAKKKKNGFVALKFIVFGVLVGGCGNIILVVIFCFKNRLKAWFVSLRCRRGVQVQGIEFSRSSAAVVATWFGHTCSNDEASNIAPKLAPSLSDLSRATGGFSVEHIIGDGGFGKVYKGVLSDGTSVAIKKLTEDGYQGEREFDAELETLGCIKHQNLVQLFGYCSNNLERLLVYEYMPNNSLDTWLHSRTEGMEPLPWPLRIVIAKDVARGLTFLHHFCIPKIIHRDLKASNILLDANFNARLGDFGLARHLNTYDSHISTSVAGSLGYIAPEYAQSWRVTTRGDVFSFGVVLLELLSGKRPACGTYVPNQGGNLVGWVHYLFHSKQILESFFDKSLDPVRGSDIEKELTTILDAAIRCTHEDPSKRPVMLEVLRSLEGDV